MQYELDYGEKTISRAVGGKTPRQNPFNCHSRVLNHDFNKETGQLAVSSQNCFFIYSNKRKTDQSPPK